MARVPVSPENREQQMIAMAVDLAERQLREGTASSQVITHYLKLGSTKSVLENEKLKTENELLRAKISAIESDERKEQLFERAIQAMRGYSGQGDVNDDEW